MDVSNNLPEFETASDEAPTAPPKRHRKAPPKKVRKGKPGRRSVGGVVKSITSTPKRARKKRAPRKLPKSTAGDVQLNAIGGSLLAPEAAGVIRAFNALDETQRAMVFNYIQALR